MSSSAIPFYIDETVQHVFPSGVLLLNIMYDFVLPGYA